MPFGFERREEFRRKQDSVDNEKPQYIEVKYKATTEGKMVPLSFIWYDDMEYTIEKVVGCVPGHSLKEGINGYRYKCKIRSKYFYLFFDGRGWYVEMV